MTETVQSRDETTAVDERSRSFGDQVGQLRRLFRFSRPYRWRLVIGTVAVVISAVLGLAFPAIMGSLVDSAERRSK